MSHASQVYESSFEDIVADYRRGARLKDLSEAYGVSAPTISKWLDEAGEKIKRRKWAQKGVLFETHFKDIAEMYEQDIEQKQIAAQFGVSPTTIRNWLIKGGYIRKKRGRAPLAMKARAHDLYDRGWSAEAIARLFKEKPEDINLWLSEVSPGLRPVFQNPGTKPKKKMRKKRRQKKNPTIPKPPRHKCKKHWNAQERQYVFEMMQEGYSVKEIFNQTGASRYRQNKIWREMGGFGTPPGRGGPRRPKRPRPPAPAVEPPPGPGAPSAPGGEPPGRITQMGPGRREVEGAPRRPLPPKR